MQLALLVLALTAVDAPVELRQPRTFPSSAPVVRQHHDYAEWRTSFDLGLGFVITGAVAAGLAPIVWVFSTQGIGAPYVHGQPYTPPPPPTAGAIAATIAMASAVPLIVPGIVFLVLAKQKKRDVYFGRW